jgi:hypothetical protein
MARQTNEYMAAYMKRRRKSRKAQLILMLGGSCIDCGTTEGLEFDHRNPSDKKFGVTMGLDKPWQVILDEAAKCDLRCSPCHRSKTTRLQENGSVDHGGGVSGKRNCPCPPCRARKTEYNKRYNRSSVAQSVELRAVNA